MISFCIANGRAGCNDRWLNNSLNQGNGICHKKGEEWSDQF